MKISKEILLDELRSKVEFSDEDFSKLLPLFELRTYKKNECLFEKGQVVPYLHFVLKGCLRMAYSNDDGEERTIYFAEEKRWAGEMVSFQEKTPTRISLQAMEDIKALAINMENWKEAITSIPAFAYYYVINHQKAVLKMIEDFGRSANESPEQKYLRLLNENPGLLKRVALYHIASYLGMTPETLSRIRNKIAHH